MVKYLQDIFYLFNRCPYAQLFPTVLFWFLAQPELGMWHFDPALGGLTMSQKSQCNSLQMISGFTIIYYYWSKFQKIDMITFLLLFTIKVNTNIKVKQYYLIPFKFVLVVFQSKLNFFLTLK